MARPQVTLYLLLSYLYSGFDKHNKQCYLMLIKYSNNTTMVQGADEGSDGSKKDCDSEDE